VAGDLPAARPPITAALTPAVMAKLKQQFAPAAEDDDIAYFREVAIHLELDPWAGHLYLIPYDGVYRPQIAVAGRRWIAQRTGRLRGIDGPYWCGPRRFTPEGERLPLDWLEVWDDDDNYPYCARTLVLVDGWKVPANGTAKWSEFSKWTTGRNDEPKLTKTWAAMPSHMLGKVSESMALRRGFSEVQAAVAYVGGTDDDELEAEAAADVAIAVASAGGPPAAPVSRGEAGPGAPAAHRRPASSSGRYDTDRVPDHVYDDLPEARGYR